MPEPIHLATLIRELSRPQSYPHPVRSVRVVQTHTSCVFLTGEFAYKIKKPVRFSFLDYSTPALRRAYCERELHLNRRLCPDVYRDLVPITQEGEAVRVAGAGDVCEWAVRMRQIPETELLPARLAAGTVQPAEIQQLAELLVGFHARCETNARIAAYGAPERVLANAEDNFSPAPVRTYLPSTERLQILEYLRGFVREQDALLERRMQAGRIRDGHGDLRAQNIALWPALDGGIQVFDCIEFNDGFRYEDVAADLAYLAMDLDLLGHAALRYQLVERYLTRSGDAELTELLRFYQCYRACVRGKIALLALAEPEVPAADREEHRSTAAAAFDLAHGYASPPPRPCLWIMAGLSGSGKSVLARELARRLPAVRIATDEVRKEALHADTTRRLDPTQYRPQVRRQVYQVLRTRAQEWLARGEHVVLDATFLDGDERGLAYGVAVACGADFRVVECATPDAVIRQRLLSRSAANRDVSDAGIAVYEQQLAEYGGEMRADPGPRWDRVDGTRPSAEVAHELLWPAHGRRGEITPVSSG